MTITPNVRDQLSQGNFTLPENINQQPLLMTCMSSLFSFEQSGQTLPL
jgi:hypothetical protein